MELKGILTNRDRHELVEQGEPWLKRDIRTCILEFQEDRLGNRDGFNLPGNERLHGRRIVVKPGDSCFFGSDARERYFLRSGARYANLLTREIADRFDRTILWREDHQLEGAVRHREHHRACPLRS